MTSSLQLAIECFSHAIMLQHVMSSKLMLSAALPKKSGEIMVGILTATIRPKLFDVHAMLCFHPGHSGFHLSSVRPQGK